MTTMTPLRVDDDAAETVTWEVTEMMLLSADTADV